MTSGNGKSHLVIFTPYPTPGEVKVALIPTLGPDGAARLQRELTGHAVMVARQVSAALGVKLSVRCTGGGAGRVRSWLGRGLSPASQSGGDLGQRLSAAFRAAFDAGAERVVVMGTDSPLITPASLAQAFAALTDQDLVVGPTRNGGYYLIGLRRHVTDLFRDISWGTPSVLSETLSRAQRLKLRFTRLPILGEVKEPEDLSAWEAFAGPPSGDERISVVIPTLNEEAVIGECVARARAQADEVFVVDGASTDGTRERALREGAVVLSAPRGLACQMNAGALAATGDVLIFTHADTRLPTAFARTTREALGGGAVAGAFSLRIAGGGRGLRVVEWGANLRSRYLHLPYGDQCLFLRRSTFRSLGGFSLMPVLEDYELVRRLRARGAIRTLDSVVYTSGRRWFIRGVFRTTFLKQLAILGYHLGLPAAKLAEFESQLN